LRRLCNNTKRNRKQESQNYGGAILHRVYSRILRWTPVLHQGGR
jgi:hypothetical protein